ncbi:MAG: helix-turn-helix transcriptional regulator [Terriglobales bacterium]
MSIASTKLDLLDSLKDHEFRSAFNLENVYAAICFQLRVLREQRNLSQGAFGKRVEPKMAQERISILEDPNAESKPTLNTLLRLADAADVGLEVRFVPFSRVLLRSVHTDGHELEVDSFDEELPFLEEQLAFEIQLENVQASSLGITRASNNVVVLPRKQVAATPSPSVATIKSVQPQLGQSTVPGSTLNANAAVA